MLTNQLPFGTEEQTEYETARLVLEGYAPPPSHVDTTISWELSNVVMKALGRQDRYASCGEILQDLRRLAAGKGITLPLQERLQHYLSANTTLVGLLAEEEERALDLLKRVGVSLGEPVLWWTSFHGLQGFEPTGQVKNPEAVLGWFAAQKRPAILALCDFHPYLAKPRIQEQLIQLYYLLQERPSSAIVFISPIIQLPEALENKIILFTLSAPEPSEIRMLLKTAQEGVKESGGTVTLSADDIENFTSIASGMSAIEINATLQKSVARLSGLTGDSIQDLLQAKEKIVLKTDLLEYINPGVSFDDIGGAEVLRAQVKWIGIALEPGGAIPLLN